MPIVTRGHRIASGGWAERDVPVPSDEVSLWLTEHPAAVINMLPTIDGQHRLLAIATLLYPVLKSSLEGSTETRQLFSATDEFFALRVREARPGPAPSDASLVDDITE